MFGFWKKNYFFYLVFGSLFFGVSWVSAQNNFTGIGIGSELLYPVGSLQEWFSESTTAPRVEMLFKLNEDEYWRIYATYLHFDQANKDRLYYKDLKLDLKLYGAGIGYTSFLTAPRWNVQPFWQGAVTLFRWEALRGAYQLSDRLVPQRFQQAWSFAGSLGGGLLWHLNTHFKLDVSLNYQLVVAELWPALALHLENVSGLQMLHLRVGINWWF